jgi:hypothetical protein
LFLLKKKGHFGRMSVGGYSEKRPTPVDAVFWLRV